MGLLESTLKTHAEFSKYTSPAEDIALSCSQTWQRQFMKLHGKAEQGVYPDGSLLPCPRVNSEVDPIPGSALCSLPRQSQGRGEDW